MWACRVYHASYCIYFLNYDMTTFIFCECVRHKSTLLNEFEIDEIVEIGMLEPTLKQEILNKFIHHYIYTLVLLMLMPSIVCVFWAQLLCPTFTNFKD